MRKHIWYTNIDTRIRRLFFLSANYHFCSYDQSNQPMHFLFHRAHRARVGFWNSRDAIETKPPKHSLEQKGAKVLVTSRNLFGNLFRQFQKVANDKNKQRAHSFHGHGPSNPSGSNKSKGQKTNTRLRYLRSAPARSKNVTR